MIVRVLGSAAGGGVPQWNCGCANCSAARRGSAPRRSQSSFAISADGARWWLVNVSPDIAQQIETVDALQPHAVRGTPIKGFLVTDANVDHLGGLAVLRQDGDHRFTIYSSAAIRDIALTQPAFAPFAEAPHEWHAVSANSRFALDDRLRVRVIPVAGTTPGYDGRRRVEGAVVAYEIADLMTGNVALFAPVFAAYDEALRDAVAGAHVAFLDGSFWSNDELSHLGVPKPAQSLGHLPVGGPDGSLAALGDVTSHVRVHYAHLNNTTPLLDPASSESEVLRSAGAAIAFDGMELTL